MNERILNVKSAVYIGNYKLLVQFENGELRVADLSDILTDDMGAFSELKDENYFENKYSILNGTIEWENGYDIAPDYLYRTSKPIQRKQLSQLAIS